jgi:Cu-Zn family superoxide dismutase
MKGISIGLGLALAAFAVGAAAQDGAATGGDVHAQLSDANGRDVGEARFSQAADGIHVHVRLAGLSAGAHGAHVHAVGRCEAPAFASAGGHWNPTEHQHGSLNPQGQHMGDMPNLTIDAQGNGTLDYVIAGGTIHGGEHPLMDADGAALVIHAGPDDYRSDPAGNSGGRVACGVIG